MRAAVKRPQLFCRAPSTIVRNINHFIGMRRYRLFSFPGEDHAPADQPLKPMFDWLVNNPQFFTLGDESYTVDDLASQCALLTSLLPKEPSTEQHGSPGRHGRNLSLRKGGKLER